MLSSALVIGVAAIGLLNNPSVVIASTNDTHPRSFKVGPPLPPNFPRHGTALFVCATDHILYIYKDVSDYPYPRAAMDMRIDGFKGHAKYRGVFVLGRREENPDYDCPPKSKLNRSYRRLYKQLGKKWTGHIKGGDKLNPLGTYRYRTNRGFFEIHGHDRINPWIGTCGCVSTGNGEKRKFREFGVKKGTICWVID